MRWSGQQVVEDGVGAAAALPGLRGLLRSVRTPEFAGAVFHEVEARSVLNRVPGASAVPFRWTVNPYRGCTHACVYCLGGATQVLLADGGTRPIAELAVGDAVLGTEDGPGGRRYVRTTVEAHWSTRKSAVRVRLADGTVLVASGEHRFLTERGWRHVTGGWCRSGRRPRLQVGDVLLGPGRGAVAAAGESRAATPGYRRGYLCGLVRGDGATPAEPDRCFPSAHLELEALGRAHHYLAAQAGAGAGSGPIALPARGPSGGGRSAGPTAGPGRGGGAAAGPGRGSGAGTRPVVGAGGGRSAGGARPSGGQVPPGRWVASSADGELLHPPGAVPFPPAGVPSALLPPAGVRPSGAGPGRGVPGGAVSGGAGPGGAGPGGAAPPWRPVVVDGRVPPPWERPGPPVATPGEAAGWPVEAGEDWCAGFLAGMLDARGTIDDGVLRVRHADEEVVGRVAGALHRLGFRFAMEPGAGAQRTVRLAGGVGEVLRLLRVTGPAVRRDVAGGPVGAAGTVTAVEETGAEDDLYDITTGTGDFVADGVVSHNCFARGTHTYLDLDAGADFDSQIVVKVNVARVLERELRAPRWAREPVAMGTNTDPYQRAEGRYRLMPGVVRALAGSGTPFSILTKGTVLTRDLPLLASVQPDVPLGLGVSIALLDRPLQARLEPGTPSPEARLDLVRRITDAGLRVGVMVAPVLPLLTDSTEALDALLERIAAAGATGASVLALHLKPGTRPWFLEWLGREHPRLVEPYARLYRRGSYVDPGYRRALGERVAPLLRRHGLTGPVGDVHGGWRRLEVPPTAEDLAVGAVAAAAGGEQLSLL